MTVELGLPKLIGYPGGKDHLADQILKHMPAHRVYVEPFAGGLGVYWKKDPAKIEVISDLDGQLVKFYKGFRCSALRACVSKNPPTVKNRIRFTQAFRKGTSETCPYFMARRLSFNNNGKDVNYTSAAKQVGKKVLSKCDEVESRLRRTRILNQDYRKVVRKYDAKDAFIYLDPPYLMRAKGLYKHEGDEVSIKEVCNIARSAKGKVLISQYDNAEVRSACKGLHMKSIPHRYVSRNRNHGKVHRVRELLIANYPLK